MSDTTACHCTCGTAHGFGSYHHDIPTDAILWFVDRTHRNQWVTSQTQGVDLEKAKPAPAQPRSYYSYP